jgi:hypothetical protein
VFVAGFEDAEAIADTLKPFAYNHIGTWMISKTAQRT